MNQQTAPEKGLLEKHVQTLLLSIITAGILTLFGFLWSINRELAILQERDVYKTQTITNMQQQIVTLTGELQSFKDKVREELRDYNKTGK